MPTKFLPISLMVAFFWCFTFNAFSQGGTLPLNGSVNGKIQANATDTWQVTTTSDGLLQFTITSNDPSNYVNAALYDHNGTTVISNVGTSTPGGHVVVSVDGLSAGTYFVKVYAYSPPQNPAYTLSNTFTTAPVANDMEPNNSRTLASLLKLNDSTTGHVGFYYNNLRDTSDWYKVTTTSDGLLRLKITTEPASQSFYLNCTLYDNNGMTVLNSNTTTGNTSTLLYTDGLDAGTYYVKLSQYNTNDYVSYKLADSLFAPPVANDAEPDSTRALALTLPLNGGRTGHLGYYYNNHRDSTDWYKVTTTSDGLLRLYITTLPSTVSDYINCTLYDNNGVIVLNSNTTTGNTNTIINTDGLDAGTYYIKMSQYNVGDYVSYKLADSLFAPPVGNDIEPDSTRALALTLPLNGGMTGHLGYYYNNHRDSTDWYKVTTTTDGLLRLFITTKPSTLSAYLNCTLYDNNGIIVLNSNTTTGNASTIINTDGLDAGTYYIKLSQYNNTDYVSYKLADSLFAPPVANDAEPDSTRALALVLPLNGGMTGHLGYYYNNHRDSTDWYKVTTTSDGLLRLYMTTEPSTVSDYINCTLYDNNGIKVLNSNTTTGNATTILNTDGLAAGTYYVKMSQYGINDYVSYKLADSLFAPPVANDIEPDSTRALALTLPLNGGTTGHLGYFYDNHRDSTDWYKVTIPSDGLLRLNITTEPSTVSDYINCTLYDNNGNTVINSNTTTGAATTFLPTDGLAAGTYYVKMSQYGNNDYVSYKLADSLFTYKYAADTAYEPNGSAIFAKTIPSNSTTTGHFGFYYNNVRDTTDWFKINYTGNTGNLNLT
ncbi:MAG: PPC domain-containing protein, partial [Ginsengibacter sp.]